MKQTVSRFMCISACFAAIAAYGCGNSETKTASSMPSASASIAAVGGNLLDDVKRRGVLVVSTDADYKPQSFRNADGSWVGFDVDVGREVARRLGVKPQFENTNFDVIT